MTVPEAAIPLFQKKITAVHAMIVDIQKNISEELYEELKRKTHDLAGVSAYFNESELGHTARELNHILEAFSWSEVLTSPKSNDYTTCLNQLAEHIKTSKYF